MRTKSRTALGITVGTVATAALLLAGTGVAAADENPPPATDPTTTQGPITLTQEQSVQLCTVRIPARLARIDRIEERISGSADTPGSTTALQSRADRARAAGLDALADRIERRITNRPAVLEQLAELEKRIVAFRDENCA